MKNVCLVNIPQGHPFLKLCPDLKNYPNMKAALCREQQQMFVVYKNGRLEVESLLWKEGVRLDLSKKRVQWGKSDLLPKALGGRRKNPEVWDLTAGLGQDALALVDLGYKVKAFEKNPLVYWLLREALEELGGVKGLCLYYGQAENFLSSSPKELDEQGLLGSKSPDAIYMDPMFAVPRRKASSSKQVQFLQKISETHEKSQESQKNLLKLALKKAKDRVVVKRSKRSKPLIENVTFQFIGNSVRYDMYLKTP